MSTQPIRADHVKYLREMSGCGIYEAKKALELCDGDMLLAEGYLRYMGLAINVRPQPGETQAEAYNRWVWNNARNYKAQLLEGRLPVPTYNEPEKPL